MLINECSVQCSGSMRIRIDLESWIRIRIKFDFLYPDNTDPDPDPGEQKFVAKNGKKLLNLFF